MPEPKPKVYPILLAGGSGTRLWPVSRELYPKQLVKFIGKDSLVQATIKRLAPVLDLEHVRIVCGSEHYHEIARHISAIGITPENKIIPEPCGRNTAPAILLALLELLRTETDAVVLIFPADHVIKDIEHFHKNLQAAIALACKDHIVTFGIKPTYPETGYGYIEGADPVSSEAFALKRFVEKPDRVTAQKYLDSGNFFWNAGMFAFQASVMVAEFEKFQPKLYRQLSELLDKKLPLTRETYGTLPDISIDYAIMEHTDKGVVLPSEFGWSDIGSWKSLYDFLPKDNNQNVVDGDVITRNTSNCFIMGRDRLIAASGVKEMVIVETPDSVFVSDLENSREVKSIVMELKERGRREYQHHRTIHYAWGKLTNLERKERYGVDRLIIYPGQTFKIQVNEEILCNLMVVAGQVSAHWGDQTQAVAEGESLMVPSKEIIINNNLDQPVTLIRVICGNSPLEDV